MRGFQPAGNKTLKKNSTGPVRGPGTGTSDEVADTVQEGTYIMPTDSTEAIGEQNLAAMGKGAPVDVQLSNGEYKLPPEQVHAIGVQALDQMKGATHTPVAARRFAPGAQQDGEPPLFFVNGGEVDEENRSRFAQVPESFGNRGNNTFGAAPPEAPAAPTERKAAPAAPPVVASPNQASPDNIFPQASPSAGANVYGAAGFSADQFGSSGKFANVPSSIGHQPGRQPAAQPAAPVQPGMTDAQREQAISQIPTGGVASPARVTPVTPAAASQANNQPLGAQAASDRAKLGAAWDTVKDVNDDAGRAIADVAMMVPRGLAGAYDSAVVRPMRAAGINASYLSQNLVPNGVDPSSMTPFTDQKRMQQQAATAAPAASVASPAAAPEAPAVPADYNHRSQGEMGPPNLSRLAVAPESAPAATQPSATEIAPGVFRSGNSYSDSAAGAQSMQTRGLPSAQNMAAADALAQRSQAESMGRVMAAQPVERGWSGVIGTDPAAGRERKQIMDALSTPLTGDPRRDLTLSQRNGMLSLLDQEARSAQAKASNAAALQQTEMQTGTQRDVAAMREAGDTGRAVLRETGENSRAGARNAIEQDRLGLEQKVRGFDIRAGQRQEKLYEKYDAAKTPEEKSAIAQQIRDLSGKADQANLSNNFMKVKRPVVDERGNVVGDQDELIDLRTIGQGGTNGQGAQAGIPKVGDTRDGYRYKGGNPNDKANWQKV